MTKWSTSIKRRRCPRLSLLLLSLLRLHVHESTPPISTIDTSPHEHCTRVHPVGLLGLLTSIATKLKKSVHDMLFPTQNVMENLLSNIVFAPGLLNVSRSAVPSTIDFFKSPSTDVNGLLGIWLILFEKADCRPKFYIGFHSPVNVAGMNTRFTSYNNGHTIPQWFSMLSTMASPLRTGACSVGQLFHTLRTDSQFVHSVSYSRFSFLLHSGLCTLEPRLMVCQPSCLSQ